MRIRLAFEKAMDGSDGINFLEIGDEIWPFANIQISAPVKFGPCGKKVKMSQQLCAGVEIGFGKICFVDCHGLGHELDFIPAEKDISEDIEGFQHPYPSLKDRPVLVHRTYSRQSELLEVNLTCEPGDVSTEEAKISTIKDYIERFGDG